MFRVPQIIVKNNSMTINMTEVQKFVSSLFVALVRWAAVVDKEDDAVPALLTILVEASFPSLPTTLLVALVVMFSSCSSTFVHAP